MAPKLVTDENDSPIGLVSDDLPAGYMVALAPIHDRHKIAGDDDAAPASSDKAADPATTKGKG